MWQSVKNGLSVIVMVIAGALFSVAYMLLKVLPDRENKRRKEAELAAAKLKAELQKAHEERAAKFQAEMEAAKAEQDRLAAKAKQDAVAVANQFIIDAMKDEK